MRPHGMHDEEGRHIVPKDGLCLALTNLSSDSAGKDYLKLRPDINWFVRLQWGYNTTGTIPGPGRLEWYLEAVERFSKESRGVYAYLIGNEPNHEQERPDGMVITPEYYAETYKKVYAILKRNSPTSLVSHAAYAPYHATPSSWLDQLKTVLSLLEAKEYRPDFINIHAYLRGATPAAVTSDEKMRDAPLTGQYASFRTYRDALSVVPPSMRSLPAFITECNELLPDGWLNENTGIVKAVYRETDYWNGFTNSQKVKGVFLYRWPKHDKFFIEGKQGVIDDFAEAITESPQNAQEGRRDTFIPSVVQSIQKPPTTPPGASTGFERDIDPKALARGVRIEELPREQAGWRVKKIDWLNVKESQGRHHILYDLLNPGGQRVVGEDLIRVVWSSGFHLVDSELKPGEPYSANFPMSSSRNDFSTWVQDEAPSEKVTGIGMGSDEGDGFNASNHTSTVVIFQFTEALSSAPPVDSGNTMLAHPVVNPKHRIVTQGFAENPSDYARFGIPGHNGVDFATPLGSMIQSVDDGEVIVSTYDGKGFGNYLKIRHEWGESLYAHLRNPGVAVGQRVERGDVIADSGNSGNSEGPHLHFGIRPYPLNVNNGYNGYVDPLPFLKVKEDRPTQNITSIIKQVAAESGVDWRLLASMAWAESSFRPELDDGLLQIGDDTWNDWAGSVGASDINDPLDNARVGAAYYEWLLDFFDGDEYKALAAYNFGVGNVSNGVSIPDITNEYVNKVRHGRDLLKAIGA